MTTEKIHEEKTQSGAKVAIGIVVFIVGLVALLIVLKMLID